jgi:hypothetical protein
MHRLSSLVCACIMAWVSMNCLVNSAMKVSYTSGSSKCHGSSDVSHLRMSFAHPLISGPLISVSVRVVLFPPPLYRGMAQFRRKYPSSSSRNCSTSSLSPVNTEGNSPIGLVSGHPAACPPVTGFGVGSSSPSSGGPPPDGLPCLPFPFPSPPPGSQPRGPVHRIDCWRD